MDHVLLRKTYYNVSLFVYGKSELQQVKPPIEFGLLSDTTCHTLLRSKLNNMLLESENKNVSKVKFFAPWIDIDGTMKYDHIELKSVEVLKVVWRTYNHRLTKGPIEFDATIFRSVDDIIKMLKRP